MMIIRVRAFPAFFLVVFFLVSCTGRSTARECSIGRPRLAKAIVTLGARSERYRYYNQPYISINGCDPSYKSE